MSLSFRKFGLIIAINLNFAICSVVYYILTKFCRFCFMSCVLHFSLCLLPLHILYVLVHLLPRFLPVRILCILFLALFLAFCLVYCISCLIFCLGSHTLRLLFSLSLVGFPFSFECNRSTRFFSLYCKSG